MYRAPTKRRQIIQRTIVYTLMTTLVVALVTFAVLLMLGFRFNKSSNGFQQGGLVQFSSRPNGAKIKIGSAELADLTSAKITVNPGDYPVTMKRDGYLPWRKDVTVRAGEILWLNYAQLVPTNLQTTSALSFKTLSQTMSSPNGKYITTLANDTTLEPYLVIVDNDTVKQESMKLPATLVQSVPSSRFSIVAWSDDSDKILVKQVSKKITNWYVIDRVNPDESYSITTDYDITLSTASFDPRNSERLFVRTTKGEVRLLDSRAKSLSAVLLRNVTQTSFLGDRVLLYIQKNDKGVSTVGYLTLDKSVGHELTQLSSGTVANIAAGTYFGDTYIATTTDKTLDVYRVDTLPSSDSEDVISMTNVATNIITKPVTNLSIRSGGRFVIAQSASLFVNYDIELQKFTSTDFGVKVDKPLQWLDRYHAYFISKDKLQVVEFDGANRHAIASASSLFSAVQSQDAKYIYSFKKTNSGYELQRTQMVSN